MDVDDVEITGEEEPAHRPRRSEEGQVVGGAVRGDVDHPPEPLKTRARIPPTRGADDHHLVAHPPERLRDVERVALHPPFLGYVIGNDDADTQRPPPVRCRLRRATAPSAVRRPQRRSSMAATNRSATQTLPAWLR